LIGDVWWFAHPIQAVSLNLLDSWRCIMELEQIEDIDYLIGRAGNPVLD